MEVPTTPSVQKSMTAEIDAVASYDDSISVFEV